MLPYDLPMQRMIKRSLPTKQALVMTTIAGDARDDRSGTPKQQYVEYYVYHVQELNPEVRQFEGEKRPAFQSSSSSLQAYQQNGQNQGQLRATTSGTSASHGSSHSSSLHLNPPVKRASLVLPSSAIAAGDTTGDDDDDDNEDIDQNQRNATSFDDDDDDDDYCDFDYEEALHPTSPEGPGNERRKKPRRRKKTTEVVATKGTAKAETSFAKESDSRRW